MVARRFALAILLVHIVLGAHLPTGLANEMAYVPHGPVEFKSNQDFGKRSSGLCVPNVANAVTSGCGTASDPWVIEGHAFGYQCLVLLRHCFVLRFEGTTDHVIIRNNFFPSFSGAHTKTDSALNTVAVGLYSAKNIHVAENTFDQVALAMYAADTTGLTAPVENIAFVNNEVRGTKTGILFLQAIDGLHEQIIVNGNQFTGTESTALSFSQTYDLAIVNNVITGSDTGVDCRGCSSVTIDHNTIQDNDVGIDIRFGDGVITDNKIRDNRIGAQMDEDWPANGNNIRGNSEWGVTNVRFPNNSPDWTDNYWGSALGPGPCEGCGDNVTGLLESEYEPYLLLPNEDAGA